jgi:urease accessory protein
LTTLGLPTGTFSHSYGLETYVQDGTVHDLETFRRFVIAYLLHGLAPADAAVVALAHQAVRAEEWSRLEGLDRLLTALKVVRELRAASLKTGRALLRLARQVFPSAALDRYADAVAKEQARGNMAVVFGCITGSLGPDPEAAVLAFLSSSVGSLTTVATRLIPLRPTAAQRLVRELQGVISRAMVVAVDTTEAEVASSVPAIDIAGMRHERLYSRLYMS